MFYEDDTAVLHDVTAGGHWIPPNVPNWMVLSVAGAVTLLGLLGVLDVDPTPLAAATVIFVIAALLMLPARLRITDDALRCARTPLDRSIPLGTIVGFQFARPRLAPYDDYFVLVQGDPRPRFLFNSGTIGYEQILLHLLERTGLHQFEQVPRPSPRSWAMCALLAFAACGVVLQGAGWFAKLLAHAPLPK